MNFQITQSFLHLLIKLNSGCLSQINLFLEPKGTAVIFGLWRTPNTFAPESSRGEKHFALIIPLPVSEHGPAYMQTHHLPPDHHVKKPWHYSPGMFKGYFFDGWIFCAALTAEKIRNKTAIVREMRCCNARTNLKPCCRGHEVTQLEKCERKLRNEWRDVILCESETLQLHPDEHRYLRNCCMSPLGSEESVIRSPSQDQSLHATLTPFFFFLFSSHN